MDERCPHCGLTDEHTWECPGGEPSYPFTAITLVPPLAPDTVVFEQERLRVKGGGEVPT